MAGHADLLVKNSTVVTMDSAGTIWDRADVAVRGDRIVAIGPDLPYQSTRVIHADGQVVLPGLVNAHMHECLLRGFCEDLPLMEWLEQVCFPVEQAHRAEHMRPTAIMNQLEMIQGGITTFIDIYRYCGVAAEVAEVSGLRAIFCPQIIESTPGAGETLATNEIFVREWRDRVPGRIQAWFGPHAPYSCSKELYRTVADLAERYDVGIHTHLSETEAEVRLITEREGVSPVKMLDDLGVLSPRLVCAHCVHVSEADIALMAERDVGVAYNPSSNMKLASGVAPIPELLAAGVRVGLGTDSNLSNNNLDMFEEMRLGAMLQKLWRRDAAALPAEQALRLATIGGAAALGLEADVGSIEVGKKADMIIVDLHRPHLWPILRKPVSNLVEQLVYSANASDVRTTIVDGQLLMEDRRVLTLDEAEAESQVAEAAADLVRRANLRLWREPSPEQAERG